MGNCFFLNGAIVLWSSKKQQTVSTSTTEAEYIALGHAVSEAVWIRRFINEMSLETVPGITLNSDNEMSITLTKNAESQHRTKHIDVQDHYIRELIDKKRAHRWVGQQLRDASWWHDQSSNNRDVPKASSAIRDGRGRWIELSTVASDWSFEESRRQSMASDWSFEESRRHCCGRGHRKWSIKEEHRTRPPSRASDQSKKNIVCGHQTEPSTLARGTEQRY